MDLRYANNVYGVVILEGPLRLDAEATNTRRTEMAGTAPDPKKPDYLIRFHENLNIQDFLMIGEREMES
jgi:hypothetical protein